MAVLVYGGGTSTNRSRNRGNTLAFYEELEDSKVRGVLRARRAATLGSHVRAVIAFFILARKVPRVFRGGVLDGR